MKFDPRLREAAEEFKALCVKYDCVGSVLFVSPTNAEYVNHLSASWSAMKYDGTGVSVRCKREDFDSREAQEKVVNATAHAMTSIYEWHRTGAENYRKLITVVMEKWKFLWRAWDRPDSVPGDGK